jgi:hypothetical protein
MMNASIKQLRGKHQKKTEAHRRYGRPIKMFAVFATTAGQQRDQK